MTIEAEYLNAVREEVINIKEYATVERCQSRLEWESFDPECPFSCVYGQLYVSAVSWVAVTARTACAWLRVNDISDKSLKNPTSFQGCMVRYIFGNGALPHPLSGR